MASTENEQPAIGRPEPQAEHEWLRKMLGEWESESGEASATGMPQEPLSGTETVRQFGDYWVIAEGRGEVGGQRYENRMTLGYDVQNQRFVGTFMDSSMPFLWVYEGRLEGDVLTLESEGPTFDGSEGTARYRDIVQFVSDDHRVLRSDVLGPDGDWREFMSMHHRRKGSANV